MKTVGITIVSHNSYEDVLVFFNSFMKYNSPNGVKFLILETSTDSRIKNLKEHIQGEICFQVNCIPNNGYAYACNQGLKYFSDHDILILSNADIVFESEIMTNIREKFGRRNYGSILQKNPRGRVVTFDLYPQFKGLLTELFKIHRLINKFKLYNPKYVYIVGAFMIFGNEIIKRNGTFDENFFLYCEETDYYYRLRDNSNSLIIKDKYVTHTISSSIGKRFNKSKSSLLKTSLTYYCKKYEYSPLISYWEVSEKVNQLYGSILGMFVKRDEKEICL